MDATYLTRSLWRALFFLVFSLWAVSVRSGTIDPNTPDEKYVEFGKQFPCIVRLRSDQYEKVEEKLIRIRQWGSGVIIRPHWLLTAAHVVTNVKDHCAVKDDDSEFPLSRVFIHDEFNENTLGHFDIALAYSPKDFELDFYCPLYRKSDELGKAVTISGYGIAGTFLTGGVNPDHQKRAGHNAVEGIERSVLICRPDRGSKRFPLEFLITPGDSGGGLFIGSELAGINSFLMAIDKKPNGTYTDEAAHIRVSVYADWADSVMAKYEAELSATNSVTK